MSEKFDCQACGACCLSSSWGSGREVFVDVSDEDAERIEAKKPGLLVPLRPQGWYFNPNRFAMRIKNDAHGRCAALRGRVGEKVSCTVYKVRPEACRTFEPGSDECLDARARRMVVSKGQD